MNRKLGRNKALRDLQQVRKKIENVSETIDTPINALEKFSEMISTITSLVKCGILPQDLLSKLTGGSKMKNMKTFFRNLKRSVESFMKPFQSFTKQFNIFKGPMNTITNVLNSIQSKFRILNPIDTLFKRCLPWINKAEKIMRSASWFFNILMVTLRIGLMVQLFIRVLKIINRLLRRLSIMIL